MPSDQALIAHVLRRTGFGPYPGQVETAAESGVEATLEAVLTAAPPADPGPELSPWPPADVEEFEQQREADMHTLMGWWIERMLAPEAGLAEKMVWFWHGHFTSSAGKVEVPQFLWAQQQLFRTFALGNFRDLAQAITIDPAMLVYLDGGLSSGQDPNENYAREVMELYTLGQGNYTEEDVRAGAKSLAGWQIDEARLEAWFEPAMATTETVTFLGRTGRFGSSDIIDMVCDNEALPPWISAKLYRYFVGAEPTPDRLTSLAAGFRASDLELAPLVEEILRDPAFLESRMTRPKYPIEWVNSAMAALGSLQVEPLGPEDEVETDENDPEGADDPESDEDAAGGEETDEPEPRWAPAMWAYETLSQTPFFPPNVAGWPEGDRWNSAPLMTSKSMLALEFPALEGDLDPRDGGVVAAALRRASMYEMSDETVASLNQAAGSIAYPEERTNLVRRLVLLTPEFNLA